MTVQSSERNLACELDIAVAQALRVGTTTDAASS
jgi:hypothetical protein